MPLAAALLVLARLGGGTGAGSHSRYSTVFLVVHVGFVSFAFAAFTLAAGLSALYLWQERRLKSHRPASLLGRTPSLVTLETLAGRTIAAALPALTVGIVAGLLRLRHQGGALDALMARHPRRLARCTRRTSSFASRPAGAAGGPHTWRSPGSRSSSSPASASS